VKPVLETSRLALRELSLDDLDFVAGMLAHPEVMRFYPQVYSREESRLWIERQLHRYAGNGHGLWLVQDRATGEPLGQVGLLLQLVDGVEEPEIGYLIHRPFWRRGLATEAALAVRSWAFDTMGLERVISLIRPENTPSQGVARKLGMRPEKRSQFHWLEHVVFAVRPDEI
jgi:ribosomal-protein-alanine N-acetyltransferase